MQLRTNGGNKSGYNTKLFDKNDCDYLFVVDNNLNKYLIPRTEISSTTSLSLKKYDKFIVNF